MIFLYSVYVSYRYWSLGLSKTMSSPLYHSGHLQVKKSLQLPHSIFWASNRMSNRPLVLIYLIIVTTLVCLVAKEVDSGVLDTALLLGLALEVLEAVGLVPALWKDVKGDLASDGVAIATIRKGGGHVG